jgi:hypothetical protein
LTFAFGFAAVDASVVADTTDVSPFFINPAAPLTAGGKDSLVSTAGMEEVDFRGIFRLGRIFPETLVSWTE